MPPESISIAPLGPHNAEVVGLNYTNYFFPEHKMVLFITSFDV